jgi:hypothetical protein
MKQSREALLPRSFCIVNERQNDIAENLLSDKEPSWYVSYQLPQRLLLYVGAKISLNN